MKIEITYQVDNHDWTDEEFDTLGERSIVLTKHDLKEILNQRGLLEENVHLDHIVTVKTKIR